MTRRNPGILVQYNPKIEASARRNQGQTLQRKKQQEQRERQSNLESTSAMPPREPELIPNKRPFPNATTPITNPTPLQALEENIRKYSPSFAPTVVVAAVVIDHGEYPLPFFVFKCTLYFFSYWDNTIK
ncbi:hypothetical protein J1N35_015032 [Gossypium stocksii]|uniref:Uncharacterized protein n=1 Tax=Gossypium stocksii TaxID=47602 RepID=A0A9D3VX76_9ROSI|nr:hypothetical protein J1N35_015032 [Gossypium stocksii]